MNQTPEAENDSPDDDALKRRLLNRIAVAAVVMVGLLGSLAIFDAIYAPAPATKVASLPPKSEVPAVPAKPEPAAVAPEAAPVETKPLEPKPGEPAAAPVAAKTEPVAVAKAEVKAVPEGTVSPAAPPLLPLPAEKPLTRPATGRPASIRPSEPVPAAASPAARPEAARELAQAPAAAPAAQASPAGPRRAPASRPLTQAAEHQYALQMGVFGNLANAEELRAKLELHGIPSTIEARVHAGPFASREQVELARAKLKELGLEGLLVTLRK